MSKIKCPDGDNEYAGMRDCKCKSCGKRLTDDEAERCKGYCPKCLKDSLLVENE